MTQPSAGRLASKACSKLSEISKISSGEMAAREGKV